MTDGRIPGKWINEPRFAEMNVSTWCILTKAITWCNEAGTDGMIKRRYLPLFHPSDDLIPSAYAELVDMGIWEIVDGGYQFVDWSKPAHRGGLGQSTNEQVQKNRAASRATSAAHRAKKAGGDSVTSPGHVGQDRTGQDRLDTQVVPEENSTWETAVPGRPELKVVGG